MSMAIFLDTFRRAIGMMPDVLSKPFMEAATSGFGAVFENETPKEPQIIYSNDIAENEKAELLKDKELKEAIETAKKQGLERIFVGKTAGYPWSDAAINRADDNARATMLKYTAGTLNTENYSISGNVTGAYKLGSKVFVDGKNKKGNDVYTAYAFIGGGTASVANDAKGANRNPQQSNVQKQPASETDGKPYVPPSTDSNQGKVPKEPYIVYYRDITEDEKNMLLKNKNFNEAIGTAKTDRIPNLFVGKGISTSEQMARNIADTTARSIQVNANQGTTTLTGTQTLASVTQYSEKDKKYRIYSIMSGSRNANQNATSMPQPTPTETNNPQTAQVTQVVNANTQGDQKEPASGQTDAAPIVQANPTPPNPSQLASNPQTAPAAPNVAVNQTQATPAAQTTPKPAQTQAPRQIPQAINNIAQRVGAQARTNKQGFPVIRKGNLLTTFNTRDKWVSFYDLTKKQRVASFRYADDNALAQRANATVKSINDLSRASG